jgi:hypothetical protein
MSAEAATDVGRLPDFVIAGVMKSGTTSLRNALGRHPEVYCAPGEPHFFCGHVEERALDWYTRQFRDAGQARVLGEKTADYLAQPRAVERMAQLLPDARVIVILRNPVDRAYSHYWHQRMVKKEHLSFAEAVNAEPGRLRDGQAHLGYVEDGRFAPQLERLASFYPRDSIHVMLLEEFRGDPATEYERVCRFLGVDETFRPSATLRRRTNPYRRMRLPRVYERLKRSDLYRHLPRVAKKNLEKALVQSADYPPMEEGLRARLTQLYAPDNAALAEWLGRRLPAWEK